MTSRRSPQHSREEGAVAVVLALVLTTLVLMGAVVIDLGLARVVSGRDQSVADQAAAAAANQLDVLAAFWNGQEACETALAFAESNLADPGSAAAVGGADCAAQFGTLTQCTDTTSPDPAVYEIGRHRIVIRLPVPDAHALMQGQGALQDAAYDGRPCERVAVEITTERDYLLAGVAGFDSGQTSRGAVGRVTAGGEDGTYASLAVLHPNECQLLVAQNVGTRIQVGSLTVIEDGESVVFPGAITIYSTPPAGACTSNNDKVIRASSSGARIETDGLILSYGASRGADNPGQIYQQADLDAGRLEPRPRPGPPVTRSYVDHEYNCMNPYPTSGPAWRPNRAGLAYTECDEGTTPYLRELHDALQTMSAGAAALAGWRVFPDPADPSQSCNDAQLDVDATGESWFIDCPGSNGSSGATTFQPQGFTLDSPERVVFRGGIRMTGGSSALRITGPDPSGTIVYLQEHGVTRNSGDFILDNVFLYVNDGRLDLAGTAGLVTMTPPLGDSDCAAYVPSGTPPADCFRKVSLWSNMIGLGTNDVNRMGGGATMLLRGVLFSPNNAFEITGSGADEALECLPPDPDDPWAGVPSGQKLNLRDAQFWTSRVTVGGGGVVTMCPSPEFAIEVAIPGSSLIR